MKEILLDHALDLRNHGTPARLVAAEYHILSMDNQGAILNRKDVLNHLPLELPPQSHDEMAKRYAVLERDAQGQPILVHKDALIQGHLIELDDQLAAHLDLNDDFQPGSHYVFQSQDFPQSVFLIGKDEMGKRILVEGENLPDFKPEMLQAQMHERAPAQAATHPASAGAALFGGALGQSITPSLPPEHFEDKTESKDDTQDELASSAPNETHETQKNPLKELDSPSDQKMAKDSDKKDPDEKDKEENDQTNIPTQARSLNAGRGGYASNTQAAEQFGRMISAPFLGLAHATGILLGESLKGVAAMGKGVTSGVASGIELTRDRLIKYRIKQCEHLANIVDIKMNKAEDLLKDLLSHPKIKEDAALIESLKYKPSLVSHEVDTMVQAMARINHTLIHDPLLESKRNALHRVVDDVIYSSQRLVTLTDRIQQEHEPTFIQGMDIIRKTTQRLEVMHAKLDKMDNNPRFGLKAIAQLSDEGAKKLDEMTQHLAEVLERILSKMFAKPGASTAKAPGMSA